MELICTVQHYHWGKKGKNSLVAKFASANSGNKLDETKPFAEFWMGTHPSGPSYMKTTETKLSDYLSFHPESLGLLVTSEFGSQLPFLCKILSVKCPLSIQAHPTKSHAEELFRTFPNIYKDGNHKPELAIALTEFEALCGFRPLCEIKEFLKNVPEFQKVIDSKLIDSFLNSDETTEQNSLMSKCFYSLMSCDGEIVASALEKLIERSKGLNSFEKQKHMTALVERIYSEFPKDVGVFCVYWLNYIVLSPGEALYLAPNEPHAYLSGDCLECMANSDNVIRAGLTPKFRDVQTLCEMLTYKNYHPAEILFHPIKEDEYCELFSPPVKDFAVARIKLPKNIKYSLKKRESASILIVIEGSGKLNSADLEFGKVFFIPAMTECQIGSNGIFLFLAFCNI